MINFKCCTEIPGPIAPVYYALHYYDFYIPAGGKIFYTRYLQLKIPARIKKPNGYLLFGTKENIISTVSLQSSGSFSFGEG
jgi:hypothetical protein